MKKVENVGIMGNAFRVMAGLDSVYGYDVAVNDNMNALMQYGSFKEMSFFYEPLQYQKAVVQRKYNSIKRKGKTTLNLNFISEYDLIDGKNYPEIDVLHNVGMEFSAQIYYREKMVQKSFPITYTIHGASYPYYITDFYLKKLLMPFKKYDSLICTSKAVQSAVRNNLDSIQYHLEENGQANLKYTGRLDVLPLGIDTETFSPIDKKQAREQFNIPLDAFVLLWIGRLSAYDKADLMPILFAFRRLLKNNTNKKMIFIIAGHDRKNMPFLPALEKYAKDLGIIENVIFMPEHELTKRMILYSAADVFVSPVDNIQETFGLTPIEAMACGVPQVVSDWDGYKDTVIEGVTGFRIPTYWAKCDDDICNAGLLPSEPMHRSALHHFLMSQSVAMDLNIFVQKVQQLIDNSTLLKKMSNESIRIAKERFSWKSIIPRYEELWSELKEECEVTEIKAYDKKKLDFILPRYCDYFKNYATSFINKTDIIQLTEEGKEFAKNNFPMPEHYEVEKIIKENEISKEIAQFLLENSKKQIMEVIDFMSNRSDSKIMRSCMWLIKQGFAFVDD